MNKSKKKDSRFELKWLLSGAIAAIWFSRTCLICNERAGKLPQHRLSIGWCVTCKACSIGID